MYWYSKLIPVSTSELQPEMNGETCIRTKHQIRANRDVIVKSNIILVLSRSWDTNTVIKKGKFLVKVP